MRAILHKAAERLRGTELVVLLGVLILVGGTWGFIELWDEVREGELRRFDERVLLSLRREADLSRPIGPAWLGKAGRDITALGGGAVLTIVTATVAGFLLIQRKYHAMWVVIVATVGGAVLGWGLKAVVGRERPTVVPHLAEEYSLSFPSGHSMMSAVVYLTLGSLLARFVGRWRLRIYVLGVAMGLTVLVGISRVYLGVHYPSDVLAGWTAGLVWAVLCWLVARWLQRRGSVEEEVGDGAT